MPKNIVASLKFCLGELFSGQDTFIESVNNEIQEYGQMEEPIIQKQFDGRDITTNNLCFENRLFELLHRLSDILHTF
ncbi:hypothetical protein GV828_07605 [Flavobacterium sp. NST-5]|uniref:Uncharacterized protein n=1 Tax=Flavobacterium ichthyis TaxID=2698827 RepID=A0ABW9Z8Q8_9FLAO|nr:hypothetical protein [Flavobacterium ichthyis]